MGSADDDTRQPGGKRRVELAAEDIVKIDKVGIQISSDEKHAYEVKSFCLDKIVFSNH